MGADRRRHAEHVMGTVVSFDVPARAGEPRGDGSLGRAVRWLHWVDATFSPYRDDSDVSRFGRGAVPLEECAPELAEVLQACAAISARSGGYFTTTPRRQVRPLRVREGMGRGAGRGDPHRGGLGRAQRQRRRRRPVRRRQAVADRDRRPAAPGRLALVVTGRDFAVATSGVAERGAHIVDPYTGQPPAGLASVTVVGARLAETDAYATAAFAMGSTARDWVEGLDGYEAFAITAAGATWQTSGFGRYLG
jgi:Membrane-associated lipoprotein involved in thiamine biosynthesis